MSRTQPNRPWPGDGPDTELRELAQISRHYDLDDDTEGWTGWMDLLAAAWRGFVSLALMAGAMASAFVFIIIAMGGWGDLAHQVRSLLGWA